jgi:hypothetical protein
MPSSSSVRMTRMAISPRLATRTFSNICGRGGYRPQVCSDGGEEVGRVAGAAALPWLLRCEAQHFFSV